MDPNAQTPVAQPVQQVPQNTLPAQPQAAAMQAQAVQPPVQQNPVLPQQNMQPPITAHVGKEAAPLVVPTGSEYASQAPEVALHPEVAAAGVEVTPHPETVITQDAQAVGVTPVKTAQQVPTHPTLVNLPLPADKVDSILKAPRKNPKNSLLWLATLIRKILNKEKTQQEKGENDESLSA